MLSKVFTFFTFYYKDNEYFKIQAIWKYIQEDSKENLNFSHVKKYTIDIL